MKMQRVYVTNWGQASEAELPPNIRAALAAALFTKAGMPDKRSRRSVEAWAQFERWVMERWNA